jgi:hypothetical protein
MSGSMMNEADAMESTERKSTVTKRRRPSRRAPSPNGSRTDGDVVVPADASELATDLKRRFGGKGGDVERFVERFPRHEAVARASYLRFEATRPVETIRSDDVVSELVRVAALLDGMRRFAAQIEPVRLGELRRDAEDAARSIAAAADGDDSPLPRVLAAEIEWAAGILQGEHDDGSQRRSIARARLHEELEARTDTDGTPSSDLLPVAPEWFASIVRCLVWAKAGREPLWNEAMSERFNGLVRAFATMTGSDGRLCFSSRVDVRPLLADAAKRSGWKANSTVRRLIDRLCGSEGVPRVPGKSESEPPRRPDKRDPPVVQSDWAKLAVARDRWRPDADLLAIVHTGVSPQIEFSTFGRPVFAGDWSLSIRIDGEPVVITPEWEAVSWFNDKDADYLELEWPNELGVTVCRQVLLTRGDHQVMLADAVSTPKRPGSRIDVESSLPLAAGVTVETLRPLREMRLEAGGLPLRCLPVALPPNRIDQAPGACDEDEPGRLVLRQSGVGGVYAPLVLDSHPERRSAHVDWRSLTVTENHRRLGQAEASGHRLRIGSRQLLIYRGLDGSKATRAVLGHHHASESVIGRFTKTGDVEPLVLVQT